MPAGEPGRALRPWSWAVSEAGAGPDHAAWLTFEELRSGALDDAVTESELTGFVAHRHADRDGRPMLTFIDRFHSPAFRRNLSGRGATNIWGYSSIQVRGAELLIENGYGSGFDHELDVQTWLIVRLATSTPELRLASWEIGGSDTGIRTRRLRSGEDAGSLLDYLRARGAAAS